MFFRRISPLSLRGVCTQSNPRILRKGGRRDQEAYQKPAKSIKDVVLNGKAGEPVRVQGWVKGLRKQKKFTFLDISDGLSPFKLPVIIPALQVPQDLTMHCSIDISGILQPAPNDSSRVELHPNQGEGEEGGVKMTGKCDQTEYPLAGKSKYTAEYVRQFIHLRPKTRKFGSILRIRNHLSQAIQDFFNDHDYVQVHTPLLTSNDSEGAGETFAVIPDSKELLEEIKKEKGSAQGVEELFFDKKVHLTVSGQLHLESAVGGLSKVWTMSPCFRAENNKSTRHLSEFYMLEAEIAFAYDIEDILEPMEGLVKSCLQRVLTVGGEDWKTVVADGDDDDDNKGLNELLDKIIQRPFTTMTFQEAKTLLQTKANSPVLDDKGLSREQELILTEKLNDGIPIFVINWPSNIKPFYMRQCPEDPSSVSAVDLLVPSIGELCGGSLREGDPHLLEIAIDRQDPSGQLKQSLQWYLDLRKYGGVPSGGFGLGFERLVQLSTGIKTIRDVALFPRWTHHCPM